MIRILATIGPKTDNTDSIEFINFITHYALEWQPCRSYK